jgi:hypothetical protein
LPEVILWIVHGYAFREGEERPEATLHFVTNDRQSQRSEVVPFEETYVEEMAAVVGRCSPTRGRLLQSNIGGRR